MTDTQDRLEQDIRHRLAETRLPEPRSRAQEDACAAALAAFDQAGQETAVESASSPVFLLFRWQAVGLLLCGALLGLWLGRSGIPSSVETQQAPWLTAEAVMEFHSVFPDRLAGVVRYTGHTEIITHDRPGDASSRPIILILEQGGERLEIAGFSGSRLPLMLHDGRTIDVEILRTGDGRVLLLGPEGIWTGNPAKDFAGYRVIYTEPPDNAGESI